MIKLIATDMDGTFLRDDKTYDRALFADVHQQMVAQGIKFVVASGNQYYKLQSFFAEYPDTIYIAENGAYIRSMEHIYQTHFFSAARVAKVLEIVQDVPHLDITVCGARSAYILRTASPGH